MKYTPVLVGAAVGLTAAEVAIQMPKHKYAPGIVKFGALFAGLAGELFFDWNQNVDYGLMTAASTLLGARVAPAITAHSLKAVATYSAPAISTHADRVSPEGVNLRNPLHPPHQTPTAAGCTACGDAVQAKLAARGTVAHGLARPMTGRDFRPRTQKATVAG